MIRSKKGLLSLVLIGVLLIMAACGSQSTTQNNESSNEEKVELKLAHFFPGTHPVETKLIAEWSKAIEEGTNGRVVVTSYPGETLLKAPDIYNGVLNQVADIGLSSFSYTRGRFPVLEAFELPGIVYKNSKAASKVAWDGVKALNPVEVQDTKLLMIIATGPGDLFTKMPVKSLEDLKGLELRATGISARTLELLGAVPVAMPQSEAYESLSKGIVKGNLSPVEVLQGWRHAEVVDYLTLTPFLYNNLFFITMNLDKWNALPEDLQNTIEEVTEKVYEEIGIGLWDSQNEPALKWAVEETGLEVFTLSDEETEKWINLVTPMQEEYIQKLNEQNLEGQKAVDLVKRLAEQYNETY
jgi:TRAP-type transport system periplasmic protein